MRVTLVCNCCREFMRPMDSSFVSYVELDKRIRVDTEWLYNEVDIKITVWVVSEKNN